MHIISFGERFEKDLLFFKNLDREDGREKERERNINVWLPLVCPNCGPDPQPRHVPWLGIEPVTFWFAGQHSMHWATPARADLHTLCVCVCVCVAVLQGLFSRSGILFGQGALGFAYMWELGEKLVSFPVFRFLFINFWVFCAIWIKMLYR